MANTSIKKRMTKSGPRWDVSVKQGGNDSSRTKKTFRTLSEARLFAAGAITQSPKQSGSESLMEVYNGFLEVKRVAVRKTTLQSYKYSWKHLKSIHDKKISNITTATINKLLVDLANDGIGAGARDKARKLLKALFDFADAQGLYEGSNPVSKAQKVAVPRPEGPKALTKEELDRLAAEIPKVHEAGFWMMAGLGLRKGEVEALKLSDFNMENWTVSITRTKRNKTEGPVKTDQSRRTLSIPKFMQPMIEEIRPHGLDKRMFKIYDSWGEKILEPACKRAKIQPLTPHDLRDIAAGQLLRAGLDIASVSKVLGHRDVQITASRYLGTLDDSAQRAAEVLDSIR